MSNKQIAKDLLDKLPEEASLLEIAQELKFLDGVRKGLDQADRGELISAEAIRSQVLQWHLSK